jgi:hypothetical protein
MIPGWMINCAGLIAALFLISAVLGIDPIYLLTAAAVCMFVAAILIPTRH